MAIELEAAMTESQFDRPPLDANKERLAREIGSKPDFAVDGLARSMPSRLLTLFGVGRPLRHAA